MNNKFAAHSHSIFQNVRKTIKLGVAEAVDFTNITADEIKSKILKLLEDPKYAIRSKRLSQRFRDQKETPMERAVWWIEWVLRNPQPDFLKAPTLQLGHIVGSAFDVIAFLVAIAILIVTLFAKCVFVLARAIRSTRKVAIRTKTYPKTKKIL